MASKSANTAEAPEAREEAAEAPLLDTIAAAIKKMVARGKERGYVTYDELNAALPTEQVSSEQIEDTLTMLSELGINVVESEESDDAAATGEDEDGEPRAGGNLDDEDIGRTDDPVRMYLREMGSVELLSREGEIAIAKRIEAGREMMIGGLCESPLTMRALILLARRAHRRQDAAARRHRSRRHLRQCVRRGAGGRGGGAAGRRRGRRGRPKAPKLPKPWRARSRPAWRCRKARSPAKKARRARTPRSRSRRWKRS